MARKKVAGEPPATVTPEELAEAVSADTAQLELEKLQKKIAREERKKRREIEAATQKKAVWLLPSLLVVTMVLAWIFSRLNFVPVGEVPVEMAAPELTFPENAN